MREITEFQMSDEKNNTGIYNTGSSNTGHYNTGLHNTGEYNTAHCNAGSSNTGSCNAGHHNTGIYNTGDINIGNFNTGKSNSGSWNAGWFNTDEPNARFFNRESNIKMSEFLRKQSFPNFYEFTLTKWIEESEMTDQEKEEFHTYKTTGGYLKEFTYKEAWENFWRDTDEKNRQKFLNLPNFDADIFLEITGIDVLKNAQIK